MINWKKAREAISSVFFGDRVEIFALYPSEDKWGEVVDIAGDSIGTFDCNIEYGPISNQAKEGGVITPQSMRVSLDKFVPMERGTRYVISIVEAKVQFEAGKTWEVVDWVEGQISTVITAKKKEIV